MGGVAGALTSGPWRLAAHSCPHPRVCLSDVIHGPSQEQKLEEVTGSQEHRSSTLHQGGDASCQGDAGTICTEACPFSNGF